MAEISATVFPDLLGPRKMPVHGTRGTIGSRGCFEVYSAVGKSFLSHLGSPRSPGTAGVAGSTAAPGSGQASAGCPASGPFRGAGRLGRLRSVRAWNRLVGWEPKAGCSKCGWSSGSESRTCSRTRRRKAALSCRVDSSPPGSRVLDGPPPRPEVPDDLDGLQDQAVAVL